MEVETLNQKALEVLVPWTDTDERYFPQYKQTYEKFDEIEMEEYAVKVSKEDNRIQSMASLGREQTLKKLPTVIDQ
jgi:hypothetical protein